MARSCLINQADKMSEKSVGDLLFDKRSSAEEYTPELRGIKLVWKGKKNWLIEMM